MPRIYLTLHEISTVRLLLEENSARFTKAGITDYYNHLLSKLAKAKRRGNRP